jgi:peptidoglycan/LPS O-acetylase OafA/YrhL
METFVQDFGAWLGAIAFFIISAQKIVDLTPTKSDDKVFVWLRRIFRTLALDVPNRSV